MAIVPSVSGSIPSARKSAPPVIMSVKESTPPSP